MTPAITLLKRKKIAYTVHKYQHDQKHPSYGMEAVEKLGLNPSRVFKTLVCQLDNQELAVAIIPVTAMLNLKHLAKATGSKKCSMAEKSLIQKTTGYVLGGVSPLGQKKPLRTFIDQSAAHIQTMFVSAGRRGLEIELSPKDLCELTSCSFVPLT